MKHNILFLFNTGDVIGGGEISLMDLLFHLNTERFRPFVVCPRQGSLLEKLKAGGFSVKTIEMPSLRQWNIFSVLAGVWRHYRWIKKNQIQLVHANGSRCALYATLAARLAGVPVLWHVRVMGCDKWLDSFLSRMSRVIVVISYAVRRRFLHSKRALEKIVVIYNGIDVKKFSSAAEALHSKVRKEVFADEGVPLIGMVGRMDRYKDYTTFLYSAKELLKKIPYAKFLLVGTGELQEKLKELSRHLQLEKSVYFLGNREDIVEILAALDVFVLASKSEGFGRALAEAMAMGKPVVASRIGGIEELVVDGESGLLVPVKDPESLSSAVEKLLRHPHNAKLMGQRAQKRIQERFSLVQHVKQIEDLYEEMLKEEAG